MDMRIHKLNKELAEVPPIMRESLTIDIPLGVKHTGIEGNATQTNIRLIST
jgi:hypothetical protein